MTSSHFSRRLGVAMIALVPAFGLAACGSDSASSAASSAQAAIDSATSAAASAATSATAAAGSAASSVASAVTSPAGAPASLEDVTAAIAAVKEVYPDGVITDVDLDNNRTKYEVDIVVDGFEYDVDVVDGKVVQQGERDNDNDTLPTTDVLEVITQAFASNPGASFDDASWDDGHWEVDLDDANGNDLPTIHF